MVRYRAIRTNLFRNLGSEQYEIALDIRNELKSGKDVRETIEKRREIIKWLSSGPNPSQEHNVAREKHEKSTGSWLVDGEAFKTWLADENSFFWLNGGGEQCIHLHVLPLSWLLVCPVPNFYVE